MVDFRPSWASGRVTERELRAELPSIRTVMAGYEAASNAGLALAYYALAGDGHQAGQWEAGVFGSERVIDPITHHVTSADPARVRDFIRHWKRLVSRHDYALVVKDCLTDRELARG